MKKHLLAILMAIPLLGFGQEKEETIISIDEVTIIKDLTYFIKDSTLVNGRIQGYHPNGKINIDGYIKDGSPNGEIKRWDENGTLVSLRTFKNGIRDGEWKRWDENGVLFRERLYKDGNLIKSISH